MFRSTSAPVLVAILLLMTFCRPLSANVIVLRVIDTYPSERLSDLVNGGAPVLLDYGHQVSRTYRESEIDIEEHMFDSTAGAWGYFSLQLPPDARPVHVPGTSSTWQWRDGDVLRTLSGSCVTFYRPVSENLSELTELLQQRCSMPAVSPPVCRDPELNASGAFPVYLKSALHLDNALPWLGTLSAVTGGFQEGAMVRFRQSSDEVILGVLKYRNSRYSRRCLLAMQLEQAGFVFAGDGWKRGAWSLVLHSGSRGLRFRLLRKR